MKINCNLQKLCHFIYSVLSALAAVFFFYARPVVALDASKTNAAKISYYEEQLKALVEDENKLEQSMSSAQHRLEILERQERDLTARIGILQSDIEHSQSMQGKLEAKLKELGELWLRRNLAKYKIQKSGASLGWTVLFARTSQSSSEKSLYLLGKLDERDKILHGEISKAISEKSRLVKKISGTLGEQSGARAEMQTKKAELRRTLSSYNRLLESYEKQSRSIEKVLGLLRGEAVKLEEFVGSVTSPAKTQNGKEKPQHDDEPGFSGQGLERHRGKLRYPVAGKIVKKFGRYKHSKFSDFVFNKGLGFLAKAGAVVKTVAKGKVLFIGELPAYGKVLIVDHGNRFYSLYALLNEILVEKGDVLEAGEALGSLVETKESEKNFYFEIRHNGKPVNPAAFFGRSS